MRCADTVDHDDVGPLGLELGEVEATVEDRAAGGQDDVVRLERASVVQGDGAGVPRHVDDAAALVHEPAVLANLSGERLHQLGRVELGLVVEDDAAVLGERHVEAVVPAHREAHGPGGVELRASGGDLSAARGVRHGRTSLDRDPVVVAEPEQPLLPLAVAVDVRRHQVARVVPEHPRQLGPLQERDLRRAAAGRAGAHVPSLDDRDAPPGARQQQGRRQAGEPAADDEVVERSVVVVEVGVEICRGEVPDRRRHAAPLREERSAGSTSRPNSSIMSR